LLNLPSGKNFYITISESLGQALSIGRKYFKGKLVLFEKSDETCSFSSRLADDYWLTANSYPDLAGITRSPAPPASAAMLLGNKSFSISGPTPGDDLLTFSRSSAERIINQSLAAYFPPARNV
jgi:hypothetical protein